MLPSKVISDAGTNFVSEKLENLCKRLGIHHAVSSSYNHQSNGQIEACINFVKRTMKKCCEVNADTFVPLLQTRSTLISPGLPRLATLLFNKPTRDILPRFSRPHLLCDNHENELIKGQPQLN